jgi:uncharacterized protein YjbJ (UPF0337 family)
MLEESDRNRPPKPSQRLFIGANNLYATDMTNQEIKGRGKQAKGKIREEVGKITNNKTEQAKGKLEQAEGKARVGIGKAIKKSKK